VLLADDNPEILLQVANVIADEFKVVGSAASGLELIAAAARLDPDVVVLDNTMPGLDGIEAARQLQRAGCRSKLVFLTAHEDPDYVAAAMDAGGAAYLSKAHMASHLAAAMHKALKWQRFVSPLAWGHSDPDSAPDRP
jgi:DNA-binding NarL/FixJ family response regulator